MKKFGMKQKKMTPQKANKQTNKQTKTLFLTGNMKDANAIVFPIKINL